MSELNNKINGISFDYSRDDSSANSEFSATSRKKNSTFVNLPSMLSPSSRASANDDASIDDASYRVRREELPTPTVAKEFKLPNGIDFTSSPPPPRVVARGIDAAIPKVGNLHVNDQQLSNHAKTKPTTTVRCISNAAENPYEIDKWMQSVAELHVDNSKSEVRYRNRMPTIQELMQSWPEKLGAGLRDWTLDLPPADIDLSVEEYARIMCSLLGIPVYDGCVIESVQALLELFVEMQTTSGKKL
ncbi:hypothetical protein ACHAXH_003200 [Discostella pseudostelligera]